MDVWIVTDYQVRGVFSSLEKAKAYFTERAKNKVNIHPMNGGLMFSAYLGDWPMASFTISKHTVQ